MRFAKPKPDEPVSAQEEVENLEDEFFNDEGDK